MIKSRYLADLVGLGVWRMQGKLDFAILAVRLEGGGVGGWERGEGV